MPLLPWRALGGALGKMSGRCSLLPCGQRKQQRHAQLRGTAQEFILASRWILTQGKAQTGQTSCAASRLWTQLSKTRLGTCSVKRLHRIHCSQTTKAAQQDGTASWDCVKSCQQNLLSPPTQAQRGQWDQSHLRARKCAPSHSL